MASILYGSSYWCLVTIGFVYGYHTFCHVSGPMASELCQVTSAGSVVQVSSSLLQTNFLSEMFVLVTIGSYHRFASARQWHFFFADGIAYFGGMVTRSLFYHHFGTGWGLFWPMVTRPLWACGN